MTGTESLFADLSAEEVVMLGHALRVVPGNAVLTGESASALSGKGLAFFHEIPAFKTLWSKVAAAIAQRDDVAPFRTKTHGEAPDVRVTGDDFGS